jgi:hypothetical protein
MNLNSIFFQILILLIATDSVAIVINGDYSLPI